MTDYKLLNIANYYISDSISISLEIQIKILLENEYNNDIICIQVLNNNIFKKIFCILKDIFNIKNKYYIAPSNKYVLCDYLNLITLSKYKIINYKYFYKKKVINYLFTNIYFHNKVISIINTDIDSYKLYKTIKDRINKYIFKIKSKYIFICGINIKNNVEFNLFLNDKYLLNIFFKIYKERLVKKNIFFLDNINSVKNKIVLLKCNYIKDILLYNNLMKMICIIK
jgi:hypothetical protein